MASKRSGIVLVLGILTSFVSALELTQISSAYIRQIAEPWMPSTDIGATFERTCSITCQAGNDQDRKGFCAVHSTFARLTSTSTNFTDWKGNGKRWMENVEKKCLDACKKNRKKQ